MRRPLAPGFKPEHVRHPEERRALGRLVRRLDSAPVPGREVESWEGRIERRLYEVNLADNVKLGSQQGASVWALARDGAEVLGIPAPSVFLDTAPEQNAHAFGSGEGSSITVTSALIEQTAPNLLEVVIGHELGHLFCAHSRHRLLAAVVLGTGLGAVSALPAPPALLARALVVGLGAVLREWYRKSELSADRVALVLTQDLESVQSVLLHLAGGSARLTEELSASAFVEQAQELSDLREEQRRGLLSERVRYLLSPLMRRELENTHPWPATRLLEITAWAASDHYRRLLDGAYGEEQPEPAEEPEPAEDPVPDDAVRLSETSNRFRGLRRTAGRLRSAARRKQQDADGPPAADGEGLPAAGSGTAPATPLQAATSDAASTPSSDVGEWMEHAARQIFQTDEVVKDDEGRVVVQRGSTLSFVQALEDPPRIEVFCPLLLDVPRSGELYEALNELNATITHARVFVTPGDDVVMAVDLRAADPRVEDLAFAIDLLSSFADRFDHDLQGRFGGRLLYPETADDGVSVEGAATRLDPAFTPTTELADTAALQPQYTEDLDLEGPPTAGDDSA